MINNLLVMKLFVYQIKLKYLYKLTQKLIHALRKIKQFRQMMILLKVRLFVQKYLIFVKRYFKFVSIIVVVKVIVQMENVNALKNGKEKIAVKYKIEKIKI